MFQKSITLFTVAVALATGASATTIIFDNQSQHPGGTLVFGTSSGIASLSNGVIDQVTAIDGAVTSFAVSGACGTGSFGCLDFTTGAFLDSSTVGNTVTYRYAAGGSLNIVGASDSASGSLFTNAGFASPVTLNYNTVTKLSSLSGTLVPGLLNATLAASLGVDPATLGGTGTNSAFNISFMADNGTGSATTNSIQLAASETATPEPASVFMVSAGLFALNLIRRKRTA